MEYPAESLAQEAFQRARGRRCLAIWLCRFSSGLAVRASGLDARGGARFFSSLHTECADYFKGQLTVASRR